MAKVTPVSITVIPFCYSSHKAPELRLHLTSAEQHHQRHQVAAYWKHRSLSPTCSPLDPSPHFSKISRWLTHWSLKSIASLYSASKTLASIRIISKLVKNRLLGPQSHFLIQCIWDQALQFTFQKSCQVMLQLLAWDPS